MPNTYVEQVASVVDGPRKVGQGSGLIDCPARVAGGLARVRPADIEVVGRSYLLNKRQPGSVRPAAFIEGRGGGSVALQLFIQETRRSTGLFYLVLNTRFPGAFVGDTDRSGRRSVGLRGAPFIARTIDFGVMLVPRNEIERAVRVSNRRAHYVTEAAVVAGKIIPPGANRFHTRLEDIVGRAVLPGRKQDARIEAPDVGRLVPQRVRHAGFELSAIVATAITHDAAAIADGVDERIHARHRSLIGSVFLAELDRAPVTLHPDIGVARAHTLLDLRDTYVGV